MMTDKEYALWCQKRGFRSETLRLIEQIRTSEPVRLVCGGNNSIIGLYPSKKMRRSIQFESGRCELPYIQQLEHDEDVLEMWDQPFRLRLTYHTEGRKLTVPHVPDFFVCRTEGAGFVECKTEEDLIKLAEEKPDHYFRDEQGEWHNPPAEAAAAELGVGYAIKSAATINRVYVRNIVFLEQYMRKDALLISVDVQQAILSFVREHRGIRLAELLEYVFGYEKVKIQSDDVYSLIVRGDIYVNLYATPLAERELTQVFETAELAEIYTPLGSLPQLPRLKHLYIAEGARLIWDSRAWQIANVGGEKIWLVGEETDAALTRSRFEEYVSQGVIEILESPTEASPYSEGLGILKDAEPAAREEAERRLELIKPYLNKEKTLRGVKKERSLRRYIARFNEANTYYGNGLVGLLPHWFAEGKRVKRLPDEVYRIMDDRIKNDYESIVQKGVWVVHGYVLNDCEAEGIPEEKQPSYTTFWQRVNSRPRANQTRKRRGRKAAYPHETLIYWIDKDTPPHGDRAFQIAHADNTELDIELVCPITGENLGRPWASFLVDAYTRFLLAIVVTFDPPSYRTTMMLLRECVRKHKKLPQTLFVDRGREFDNTYLRRTTQSLNITLQFRPPSKPKVGAVVERLFGVVHQQFVHNLMGNTQITKEVRMVTKSINPKTTAVWTIGPFAEWFTAWGYEFYNTRPHWTLKHTPLQAHARSLKLTGEQRGHIPYDESFRILTMPTTRKQTAKNTVDKGVKINYIRYNASELKEREFEGKQLHVRYDPFDLSYAYVRVGKRWVKCVSDYYASLEYCTERQLKIITEEIHQRNKNLRQKEEITAKLLAEFIARAEEVQKGQAEQRLLRQRVHDRETKPLIYAINGRGYTPQPSGQTDTLRASHGSTPESESPSSPFGAIDFGKLRQAKELK